MKLTNKAIDSVIEEVFGPEALEVVRQIRGRKNVSEFKLADKLNQEVNQTRNTLYRLLEKDLVSFIRRKDKKKGWYIYYWTLKPKEMKPLVNKLRKNKLESLNDRLVRERGGNFFLCRNNCIRLDFERAFGFEFKCPECGSLMDHEDNEQKIREIEKEIERLGKK